MEKIAILGAGGFGREVLQIILDINAIRPTWSFQGFLVEPEYLIQEMVHGFPVHDVNHWFEKNYNHDCLVVVAIGSPELRKRAVQRIEGFGICHFATLIHPNAWIGRQVQIGQGSIICSGAQITTDIVVGEHVHINLSATVGHDAVLGDWVTLAPNSTISGAVILESGVDVGSAGVILPKCKVGGWAIIGAGSVVTKDMPPHSTVVGVPAKVIKIRESVASDGNTGAEG